MTPDTDADLGLFEGVVAGTSEFHAPADVSRCVECGREKDRSYLGYCGNCARLHGLQTPAADPDHPPSP